MDQDNLLYTNKFISDANTNAGYGLTAELRKQKLKEFTERREQELADAPDDTALEYDILKTNRVITPDGNLKPFSNRTILKEKRSVLNISSNQRNYFTQSDLTNPAEYINYITPSLYTEFQELYTLASGLGSNLNITTYQEYASENNIEITTVGSSEARCRNMVRDLLLSRGQSQSQSQSQSQNRSQSQSARAIASEVTDINSTLIDLLTSVAVNLSSRADFETIANTLNAFAMSGAAFNPNNFWRPFYFTGSTADGTIKIRQIVYDEQHPNSYTITLPSIIKHVKSIRLISSEIPNTINNITERNNIITVQLRRKAVAGVNSGNPVTVELKTSYNIFNFILVKLDVGHYTMDTLIAHMEDRLNSVTKAATVKAYGDVFKVLWIKDTGQVKIICQRSELEFHLKFYSQLTDVTEITNPGVEGDVLGKSHGVITNYSHDLWHILGFPWPYEITSTGADRYTGTLTNVINYGLHEIFESSHLNNDIFDRVTAASDLLNIYNNRLFLSSDKHDVINTHRVYRYPQIEHNFIYLVLKGYRAMNHVNQFNNVTSFSDHDFFAKIQLTESGVAYNTFVSNPLVFLNALDKIEKLEIQWVDERGELVDFNDVDHSFTLEFIHYVTQMDVNEYDTGLGSIDYKSYPEFLT